MKLRVWDVNLKIRLFGEGLFNLLFWMYFPFITVYFSEALGTQTAGMLMAVPPLIRIFGNMVGGSLADRLGRRPVMLAGAFLQACMFGVFAMSGSHWVNYFAYVGVGLGGALYGPASNAMVADLVPAQDRRQVFATFTTVTNIGAVLGPALGSILFFQYRSELLWTCTIILLLYAMAIFMRVHESMPNPANRIPIHEISTSLREQWKGYGIIFRDKVFVIYILAGVFSTITIMQLDLYLAIYVTQDVPSQSLFTWQGWSFRLSSTEILGWILGLNGLLFVFFVLPATKWLRRFKDRDVFILSSALAGVGMFAVGLTTHIWVLFLFTIIFTLGEIVRSPVSSNFVSQYAPATARGQYMGASNLQYTVGRFAAPLTVFLSGWWPPISVFAVILVCAIISIVLYWKLFKLYAYDDPASAGQSAENDKNACAQVEG
ncbi:MDR family MFS transporter [Paenibacillus guangzhouensis]|uniref:MDR family MFS transporter n=1 Tax=Paenibacillus guangzhouensis TaxID=1473112 RepID=UPI0012668C17|nr:MFS transporter [Paenibacillus guangzhouensis]